MLLAKEALVRRAPKADARLVIGSQFRPIPDGAGGIKLVTVGNKTVDFRDVGVRLRDFGLSIDQKALADLNSIRNDMEHHYSSAPLATVKEAVVKAFPIIADLLRQMEEDPAELLGDAWTAMLEEKAFHDHELAAAKNSLEHVQWHAELLREIEFTCIVCSSDLIEQINPENSKQQKVEFRCRRCSDMWGRDDMIEYAIGQHFAADNHLQGEAGLAGGPLHTCPDCRRIAYLEDEDSCAVCGTSLGFPRKCDACGTPITVQDYLDGLDGDYCGYCTYVQTKMMRD